MKDQYEDTTVLTSILNKCKHRNHRLHYVICTKFLLYYLTIGYLLFFVNEYYLSLVKKFFVSRKTSVFLQSQTPLVQVSNFSRVINVNQFVCVNPFFITYCG